MMHIIRQQLLHVEVNGAESEGLALQHRLSELCHHWLLPALERALDRFAPSNEYLYIERIEIDAGPLSLERLEHDLTETVANAIEKSLPNLSTTRDSLPALVSGKVQQKTERQSLHEAFIYFLKTGSLPWSFHLPADRSLEQVLLSSWQEATKSGADLHFMNDSILQSLTSANVRKRLLRQFSPAFMTTFLSRFFPEGKKVMERILQVLRSSDVPSVEVKNFEKQLWETALVLIAAGDALTERKLVGETWCTLPISAVQQPIVASWLERHWPGVTATASIRPPAANAKTPKAPEPSSLVEEQETPQAEAPETQQIEPRPAKIDGKIPRAPQPPAVKASTPLPSFTAEEQEQPSKKAPEKQPIEHPEAGEGIYIENAGLVLLHPFLPRFFEVLGIAAEDNILQPDRALGLLHYLATGQPVALEYELILPKILCNVSLGTPVESRVELTSVELEEAAALLDAVIRHWEALRDTSPDGLRGTFLVRSGKISLRDDGDWLLQVEAKSFDILLDQLPWGIGMIQLPWMSQMLWVEWR